MAAIGRSPPRPAIGALAVGLGAGFLSGLFGVGGGILLVPGLVLLLRVDQHRAHGTSLAAIVPIAAAGAGGYALDGAVHWPAAGLLGAGGMAGAVLGTHLLGKVPERGLRLLFAGFLILAAVALPFEVAGGEDPRGLGVGAAALVTALGVVAGTLGGLLGVGGGIVMVPGLVLLLGLSDAVAKGTSLAAIIPAALVGTGRNLGEGRVSLGAAAAAGIAGVGAAFAASLLAVRLDPLASAVLFGLLLLAVAVRLLLAARGRPVPGDRVARREGA